MFLLYGYTDILYTKSIKIAPGLNSQKRRISCVQTTFDYNPVTYFMQTDIFNLHQSTKGENTMYELMQNLIAFKYACKLNHWSTDNYSKHLMFDRLAEDIDTWVDAIAETYFMANDEKDIFKSDILNAKYINRDLVKSCEKIISRLEELQNDDETNEGLNSLLSGIEEGFLNKLAIAKLI